MLQRLLVSRQRKKKKENDATTRDLMIVEIEHMVGVITCASPFFFDIRGPGTDPDILVREWAFHARDEWLGAFVDLVTSPPESALGHDDWWDAVSQMLAVWARRKPELVLPQIGPLLSDGKTRAVILKAFALAITEYPTWRADFALFVDQCAPWLFPVIQEQPHPALTEDEAYDVQDIEDCIRRRAEGKQIKPSAVDKKTL